MEVNCYIEKMNDSIENLIDFEQYQTICQSKQRRLPAKTRCCPFAGYPIALSPIAPLCQTLFCAGMLAARAASSFRDLGQKRL